MGSFLHLKIFTIPRGGDITKEPNWTFDVDYITQNNSMYSC